MAGSSPSERANAALRSQASCWRSTGWRPARRSPTRSAALRMKARVAVVLMMTASAELTQLVHTPAKLARLTVGQWAHDLPDALTPLFEAVMQLGTRPAPLVLAAIALLAGWRWRALGVAVAGTVAWLLSNSIKSLVERPRPAAETLGRVPRDVVDGWAYTSSHAAISAAVVTTLLLLGRPRRPVAALLVAAGVLTCLARMHLGVHWALDVVGGASVGVLVALLVSYAVGLPPTGPVARAGDDDELVVASFNVRNGRAWDGLDSWPFRARRAATTARSLGADVLGVQEAFAFQSRFLGAALPGYARVGRGRNRRGGEWCVVYVREDRLEVLEDATHWYGTAPDVPGSRLDGATAPRIGTHLRLAVRGTGQEVQLVNTHLDERDPARRLTSTEQLVARLAPDGPTVVLGDLNATKRRDPGVFEQLEAAGLVDALRDDPRGTAHDFRGGTDHSRLDHIYVSPHFEVVDAGVVADDRTRRLPSDHWPVRARLRLRPQP
jgi:endonuclease/exonuclease/phosphatase family metal-dependent hydrolase/membrane-associated phospholipid phosphatase